MLRSGLIRRANASIAVGLGLGHGRVLLESSALSDYCRDVAARLRKRAGAIVEQAQKATKRR